MERWGLILRTSTEQSDELVNQEVLCWGTYSECAQAHAEFDPYKKLPTYKHERKTKLAVEYRLVIRKAA